MGELTDRRPAAPTTPGPDPSPPDVAREGVPAEQATDGGTAGAAAVADAEIPDDEARSAGDGEEPATRTGRTGSRRVLAVMTIVMALAIAYVAGVLTVRLSVPGENSAEAGFARDMSTHHAQAVAMAMIEYQRGTLPELRVIAYDIATVQQAQKGMMSAWLDNWGDSQTSNKPPMSWMPNGANELSADGLMPGMATNAEMSQLQNAAGVNVDKLFLQLMIKHHLGGMHMTDAILKTTRNDQVRSLATSIKVTQGPEVDQMQKILENIAARKAN
jgi:uncharacterized protein (DUF305 family)